MQAQFFSGIFRFSQQFSGTDWSNRWIRIFELGRRFSRRFFLGWFEGERCWRFSVNSWGFIRGHVARLHEFFEHRGTKLTLAIIPDNYNVRKLKSTIVIFWNIFRIFKFWKYLERLGSTGGGVVWGLFDLFNFLFSFRVTSNFLKLVSWFWFLLELAVWFADNFDKINEIDSKRIFSAPKLSPVSIFKVHL